MVKGIRRIISEVICVVGMVFLADLPGDFAEQSDQTSKSIFGIVRIRQIGGRCEIRRVQKAIRVAFNL